MKIYAAALLAVTALSGGPASSATETWTEGKNYTLLAPGGASPLPAGEMEVVEVFSYGCPACASFNATAHRLQQSLPKGAKFVYIPASFNAAEDWPMFQRAYCTAEVLGIADKAHDAMFESVWKGGELAVTDPATGRLKSPLPTIEDAARFYSRRTGVNAANFTAAAQSFRVELKINEAEAFVRRYRVDSTPTIIVNRRYRTDVRSAGGYDELVRLVMWLLAKDAR